MLIFVLLAASVLLELGAIYSRSMTRQVLAAVSLFTYFLVVGDVLSDSRFTIAALLMLIGIFRFVNALRLSRPQMHEKELRSRALRTSVLLSLAAIVMIVPWGMSATAVVNTLSFASLAGSLALLLSVVISYRKYRINEESSDKKLPSVSICIPARNETQDLPECIEAALSSDYSKLEIIVLDDCSHDKTPEVIKHYAHKGVRFIRGQEPGDKWLAKNAAYDKLADEAKGDILLFMGVDVRLEKGAVRKLVSQLGDRNMISVLPRRSSDHEGSFFIQPLRYWWELGLWRFWGSHPPVLSTCWLVRSSFLREHGGFEAHRRSIKPEAQLARAAKTSESGYQFILAHDDTGISSRKAPHDQLDTALRIRYPQLKRRPESVLVTLVIVVLCSLWPIAGLFVGIATSSYVVAVVSASSLLLLSIANAVISRLAVKNSWAAGFFLAPLNAGLDIYVMMKSMFGYELGSITWKDRNICLPMLQVEKSLPDIQK